MTNRRLLPLAALALALLLLPSTGMADSKTPGWYFDADVGAVWTGGNSESNALGATAHLRRIWPRWRAGLKGTASQTETTNLTRFATGTPTDFQVDEVKTTEKTAELYNLTGTTYYDISKYFFALGGVDWMRNRPAGIDNRTLLALGAGNTWWSEDARELRTFYNFTYTFQDDVVENPILKHDFPGLQAGYVLRYQLAESTRLESDLVGDWNLDNTDDVRIDWLNALPVSINSRLELKPSLRLLWRNQPSLEEIPLFDGGGNEIGTVTTPLDELDTIFTLALVVNFAPDSEE